MNNKNSGYLIIIGGAEDKTGDCVILKQASTILGKNDLLTIVTTATELPGEVGDEYKQIFKKLGVGNVQILNINTRDDANEPALCDQLKTSKGIFFTGGDQLRITSILGGTEAYKIIKDIYFENGGLIMGTSAGASVMSSTMIVNGNDYEPAKKCTLKMAPGLDLLNNSIIDQHFDQRGRFGRLLCGVAENPDVLGIGIDEDTAIKIFPDMHFEVLGSNVVTIIDGTSIKTTNVSEQKPNEVLAINGVTVHALPSEYGFDMKNRKVMRLKSEAKDK
ncbi:cyanophycinase [Treponema sp. R6D11]